MKDFIDYLLEKMAALRGTFRKQQIAKALSGRPTLQNQITALRRQVNAQRPETQYFRVNGNHSAAASNATEQTNHLVTDSLITSTDFRDKVTGDEWKNKSLKLKINMDIDCAYMRVVVYVPKAAGDRWAPSTFKTVNNPDPSSFWVIGDFYINHDTDNREKCISRMFSLKGLKTIYDSNASSITRGEIIVSAITHTGTASARQYTYSYELVYNNV